MRILGLDPGSRVCGYGVIDEEHGDLRYVECGVLTAPEDLEKPQVGIASVWYADCAK